MEATWFIAGLAVASTFWGIVILAIERRHYWDGDK